MPRENRIYLNFSKKDLSNTILEILENEKAGMYFDSFQRTLRRKFLFLILFPMIGIWENMLTEFEKSNKIVRIQAFWKYRPARDQLFSKKNLDNLLELIQEEEKNRAKHGPTKFFGRKILPASFIMELEELEKGDFDDADDQVTRLAGLVLAESAKLMAPHEDIKFFDFAINLENYHFREEQLETMKQLNFEIKSNIQHCKVMIHETLTMNFLNKLKKTLPENHQGVIFSFKKPSDEVLQNLENDKSIQLINEDGIKLWVSISDTIPARVNSLTKVQFDPINNLRGKIARVDSINYESGMASVTILPDFTETNIYIRSLQEIQLKTSVEKYLLYAKNYFSFLELLTNITQKENFLKGIFDMNIIDYKRKTGNKWNFTTKNNKTSINLYGETKKDIFSCDCFNWQENSSELCIHLISCLDLIVREGDFLNETWGYNEINWAIQKMLTQTIMENYEVISLDLPKDKHHIILKYLSYKQKLQELSN